MGLGDSVSRRIVGDGNDGVPINSRTSGNSSISPSQAVGTIGSVTSPIWGQMVDTGNRYGNMGLMSAAGSTLSGMARGDDMEKIATDTILNTGASFAKDLLNQTLTSALGPYGGLLTSVTAEGAKGAYNNLTANQIGANMTGAGLRTGTAMGVGALFGGIPGMIAGMAAGPVIQDQIDYGLIGDAFDSRSVEDQRDYLEDMYGQFESRDYISGLMGGVSTQTTSFNKSQGLGTSVLDYMSEGMGRTESGDVFDADWGLRGPGVVNGMPIGIVEDHLNLNYDWKSGSALQGLSKDGRGGNNDGGMDDGYDGPETDNMDDVDHTDGGWE